MSVARAVVDQLVRGDDAIHEPDAIRLRRVDHLAGEQKLERASLADETRQPLRRAVARHDAELHLGLAELRPICGEAQMTSHGKLASAAEREAVDRGERRLRRPLELAEGALSALGARLSFHRRLLRQLGDVRARDERAAGAGEQHRAHVVSASTASSIAIPSSRINASLSAFSLSGRLTVIVAIRSATWKVSSS